MPTPIRRTLLSLLSTVLHFLPLELFFLAYHLIHPTSFWEKALLSVIGLWIGGALQVVLFFLWIYTLLLIWLKD
jgi:hypothetical protein